MKFTTPRRNEQQELMLPLVNIVFLLLIFFLLVGSFREIEPFVVVPPNSLSQTDSDEHTLTLAVAADGRIAVDGNPVLFEDLSSTLTSYAETDHPYHVRIKADRKADTQWVIKLMDHCKDAGASDIRLLTTSIFL